MTDLATDPAPPDHAASDDAVQVALVGNPNTGKTTLFNRLTGIRQRTGNYPGVTVERKHGSFDLADGMNATVVDLPGTYSLAAASMDERVVVDMLAGHAGLGTKPDVAVCVTDATNLLRHLFLASQVAETGISIVIAVNMIDAAETAGLAIDTKLLSERLGVPVVATAASKGRGLDRLREAIVHAHENRSQLRNVDWPVAVRDAAAYVRDSLPGDVANELTQAEVHRLLFDAESAVAARIGWSKNQHTTHVANAHEMLTAGGLDAHGAEAILRYGFLTEAMEGVVTRPEVRKATGGESIDRILTHRVWGLTIFVLVMYAVFWCIYTGAGPMMDLIDTTFGALGDAIGGWLEGSPVLQSLVVDGLIAGVGGVVIFLPQILILFFFIALLEDTGYLARAAYLMDKLFSWCGLNGKSFVPLLSSFACAIPGVLGARTIENQKSRLTTILIAPLMSCSARLPVYVLLIGAFIEPEYGASIAAATLFGFHFVGLAVAIPIALVLNRWVFKVTRSPFVLEMPPYRIPTLRDVVYRMWNRAKDFLLTAGTVILAMSVIIWALSYFPRSQEVADATTTQYIADVAEAESVTVDAATQLVETDEEHIAELDNAIAGAYMENSYLGRAGRFVQPVFAPAGFDWKITVGVLASFPARELIVSTLGITYSLGEDVDEENTGLRSTLQASVHPGTDEAVFTIPVVLSIMMFFALCMQCGATLAVVAREVGWRWAIFSFVYMTGLAWIGAVITYQVGSAMMGTAA